MNFVGRVFEEMQYQVGPETTKPPSAVTLDTTIAVFGIPDQTLFNKLKVNWAKSAAAAKPPA